MVSDRYDLIFKPTLIEYNLNNTGDISLGQQQIRITIRNAGMSVVSINIEPEAFANYLDTDADPIIPYTPQYPGSPSTKKYVDDKFATLMGLGKFLSLWDSTTGLPISFPLTIPYTYHTGDYFMIETVASGGGTNYRPSGSSYSGTASSATESEAVQRGDFYIYDGTVWLFASNHGGSVSFSNIAGQPTDNANLAAALNSKQNILVAGTDLSITPGTGSDVINFTNESKYIKNTATGDGSITIGSSNPAPGNNGVNIGPGSYAAGYSVGIGSSAYSNGGYSVAIGSNTTASNTSSVAIGRGAKAQSLNGLAIGRDASVSAINGIAIGKDAKNSSAYAIQLGKGTISGASNECQFYVGFDGINQNWKMLDGNTGKIPNDRLNMDATPTDSSTNAVTSGGVYSAISAINGTIIAATAPLSPTEGMVWYDTTNDVLKVYDGTNWNVTGKEYHAGEGIEIGTYDDYSAMRGPCPEGFHVPSKDEFDSINTIMTNFGFTTGNSRKEKLLLPFAGWRASDTGNVTSQGTYGRYRASSQYSTQYKTIHHLYLYGNGVSVSNTTSYPGVGRNIRAFKDIPVIPDNVWTTIYAGTGSAGIFHNAALGLISISSDGTNWITIADKNLGATTVYNSGDTLSESNCGGYFQRGNNYMFPFTGTITTSSTQVDATNYGPGNYYSSSTFITAYTWDSSNNPNIRGGVTGVVALDNAISNTGVLSVNGQTGDVTISTAEESNTKTFYLSSTSDLTNAQAAYDWYLAGKNPIIRISGWNYSFILEGDNSEPTYHLGFYGVNGGADNGLSNSYIGINPRLELRYSSDTVTSVVVTSYSANTLFTNVDYSTPYTPLYDGSPATKKYVDDNAGGNTKTFYLSSSSDTTTAQSAYDWYAAGKNPIVVLASTEYFVRSASATELNFTSSNLYSVNSASGYSYDYVKGLKFALSSGTVTSVSSSNIDGGNYLKVGYNYSTPYTPQYDGSPATKKYVDDNNTVVSGDSGTTYTIKVSNSAPASGTPNTTITFVV